jgi:hypothetical protein
MLRSGRILFALCFSLAPYLVQAFDFWGQGCSGDPLLHINWNPKAEIQIPSMEIGKLNVVQTLKVPAGVRTPSPMQLLSISSTFSHRSSDLLNMVPPALRKVSTKLPAIYRETKVLDLAIYSDIYNHPAEFKDPVPAQVEMDGEKIQGEVRFRGGLRRTSCAVKPLEVDLKQTKGTSFAGASSFDLVTHCAGTGRDPNFEQNQKVLAEYFWYRAAQELLPYSFNVRLARIVYLNQAGQKIVSGYGILRESKKSLAKRYGLEKYAKNESGHIERNQSRNNYNPLLVSLFLGLSQQGDYDFTNRKNMMALRSPQGTQYIPYDFDFSSVLGGIPGSFASQRRSPAEDILNIVLQLQIHLQGAGLLDSYDMAWGQKFFDQAMASLELLRSGLPGVQKILDEIPLWPVTRQRIEIRLSNFGNTSRYLVDKFVTWNRFSDCYVNVNWQSETALNLFNRSILDGNDSYSFMNLMASSFRNRAGWYQFGNTLSNFDSTFIHKNLEPLRKTIASSEGLKLLSALEVDSLKYAVNIVSWLAMIEGLALSRTQNASEFIQIVSDHFTEPTESLKAYREQIIIQQLGFFRKLNPTMAEYNRLKRRARSITTVDKIIDEGLKQVATAADFITLFDPAFENPTPEYLALLENKMLSQLDLFFKFGPTARESLALSLFYNRISVSAVIREAALKRSTKPADREYLLQTAVEIPSQALLQLIADLRLRYPPQAVASVIQAAVPAIPAVPAGQKPAPTATGAIPAVTAAAPVDVHAANLDDLIRENIFPIKKK